MQWNVAINSRTVRIELPDVLPDNVPFNGRVDGRAVKLRWQRNTKALFILDEQVANVWTAINMRSRSISKFAGDSEVNVNAEFLPARADGPIVLDTVVSVYIPGQESREGSAAKKPLVIRSQITGKVLKVMVKPGDTVSAGDTVIIVEAMKMENRVVASAAGVVDSVKAKEGETVSTGSELIKFKQK